PSRDPPPPPRSKFHSPDCAVQFNGVLSTGVLPADKTLYIWQKLRSEFGPGLRIETRQPCQLPTASPAAVTKSSLPLRRSVANLTTRPTPGPAPARLSRSAGRGGGGDPPCRRRDHAGPRGRLCPAVRTARPATPRPGVRSGAPRPGGRPR